MSLTESGLTPTRYAPTENSNAVTFNFGDWQHWEAISKGSAGYCAVTGIGSGGFVPLGVGGFSDTITGNFAIGSIGMARCATGVVQPGWAYYGELHLQAGTKAPSGFLYEGTIKSDLSECADVDPYRMNGDGTKPLVAGHRVDNCKDGSIGPASFAFNTANLADREGSGFNVGLNICDKSINPVLYVVAAVGQYVRKAVAMAAGHALCWFVPGGAIGPRIVSYVDQPDQGLQLVFLNGRFFICKPSGEGVVAVDSNGTWLQNGSTMILYAFPPGATCVAPNGDIRIEVGGTVRYLVTRPA